MHKFLLLISLVFTLIGCAVVEGIDGGVVDQIPPRVMKNGISPKNGMTNFSANKIEFKFKEFIRLNNPSQTISIMPQDVLVDAVVKGKSLILNLKGTLKSNTTYQITMNGAVKDITESNDSLMQYVFSTGDFIDSLSYTGVVIDAKELTPIKNCFIGLYNATDSAIYKKPLYYASSGDDGAFTFNYLKAGNYTIYAFEDGNKDSKWQKTERVAFLNHEITVDTAQKDTFQLHLFKQAMPTKLNAKYTYPARITLSSNNTLNLQSIAVDSLTIPLDKLTKYSTDSVSFLGFQKIGNTPYKITINHIGLDKNNELTAVSDTLNLRTPTQRKKGLKPVFDIINSQDSYQNGDSIVFSFSDKILDIDSSKLELLIYDSIKIPFQVHFTENNLSLKLHGLKGKRFALNVLENALTFENHKDSYTFTRQFDITDETLLGVLQLDLSLLPSNAIVELIKDNKSVQSINIATQGKNVTLRKLQPGSYSFKAFIDYDMNSEWTTGDFFTKKQPEKIIRFSKGVQVRSNWDIEATLEPIDETFK